MVIPQSNIKVAIVTDWLWNVRGTEKLLDAICEIFPNSQIYSFFGNTQTIYKLQNVKGKKIKYSILNKLPFIKYYYRYTYLIWPIIVESYKFDGYDIVISLSSSCAKGVLTGDIPHICYMNSPMRYAWDLRFQYFNNHILKFFINPFLHLLRIWDSSRNNTIDYLIANSKYIASRISKYYGIQADEIIYPFFDKPILNSISNIHDQYFLYHGALEPNKGIINVVKAAIKYNFPLKVSGSGSLLNEVKKLSKNSSNIEIYGQTSEEIKYKLLINAKALIFPSNEDFGIVGLEANSVGTPVICLENSGISEIIAENKAGVVIKNHSIEEIYKGIEKINEKDFDSQQIISSVKKYNRELYQTSILKVVNTFLESKSSF
jgi:glycosyltransferase involved in cell wall biosynthesis